MNIGYIKAILPKGWKVLDVDGKDVFIGCSWDIKDGEYYDKIIKMLERELKMDLGGGSTGKDYYINHFVSKSRISESRSIRGRMLKESTENSIKNVFWEVLDIGVNGEDDWEKVEEKEDEDDKTYTSVHQLLDKFERYGEPEDVVVRRGTNIGREIDVDEIDDVLNKPEQYEVNLFIPKGKNREYRVNLFFDVVPNSMIRRTR